MHALYMVCGYLAPSYLAPKSLEIKARLGIFTTEENKTSCQKTNYLDNDQLLAINSIYGRFSILFNF